MTKDLKKIIKYLEDIVINKDTLPTINTGELVMNINKLLQCVEVLSIYKQPMINLLNEYEQLGELLSHANPSESEALNERKQVIEDVISSIHLENPQILRKEYWVDYE